ncbi:sensor histidine kinase [Niabella soli]|uniref:Signal transduction histidine kinase internal region domain-containing protein n=1 Tax=Niabella soli DSM 19437 TaxID=929713 RepID=W0F7R5_9BACT|nr:histidine kinase [Niabella soli]AHF17853.1 hypothetical protein NIASO_15305 [Niabella soli DSM 19437]
MDKINPVLTGDTHGDSIRKYFSMTMYSMQSSDVYNERKNLSAHSRDPYLMMITLYSNNLAVSNKTVLRKIPELKKYPNDTIDHSMMMTYTYAGQYAIPVFDSTGIIVIVEGINKENATEYEFRVLRNQTEVVVPWHTPTLFYKWIFYNYTQQINRTAADTVGAYLGQFKSTAGNRLVFEVRRKNKPALIQARQSALWLSRTPSIVNVFTTDQMSGFLETFKKQWKPPQLFENYEDWLPSKDSIEKLPKKFKPGENNLIFYLDDIVKSKEILEYNLLSGKDSTGWKPNDFDLNFIWLKNIPPGSHQLKVRFSIQRQNVTVYTFYVQPYWYQTLWFKMIAGILSSLAFTSAYLLLINRRQKAKFKKEEAKRQLTQAEIKSIKSQFNPHFVFNALSSIQGLITKNDIEGAYRYLNDFSLLLRNSLSQSEKEFVSLSKDLELIENYLKLEQLRFGFRFEIALEKAINKTEIEVPALLLQPVIENAVKHGISNYYDKGLLTIDYKINEDNLVVCIADNGSGFNPRARNGYGLKLTEERIRLLNKTLKDRQIGWNIKNIEQGTIVTFIFNNWLL